MGLKNFITFFDQPLANFSHLFRSAHRISFDSEYLISKYHRQSRSFQQVSGIPKGRLHALHGSTWLARERVQELRWLFTSFARSGWSIRRLPKPQARTN